MTFFTCPVCGHDSRECFRCDECGWLNDSGDASDGQRSVTGGGR